MAVLSPRFIMELASIVARNQMLLLHAPLQVDSWAETHAYGLMDERLLYKTSIDIIALLRIPIMLRYALGDCIVMYV